MTNQDKIRILRRYRKLVNEYELIAEHRNLVYTQLTNPSRPVDHTVELTRLDDMLRRRFDQVTTERCKIENALLDMQEPLHRLLITYKYIEGHTWEETAVKLSYGWAQIHRLHSAALKEICL